MYSQNLKNTLAEQMKENILNDSCNRNINTNMRGIRILYNNKTGNSAMNKEQLNNLDRLWEIQQLKEDWNGYGCEAISEKVIAISETIIKNVCIQPAVYPTGRESVQMQYELEDRSYLEFEIFQEKIICMKVPQRIYAKASFEVINSLDVNLINQIVREFYGK